MKIQYPSESPGEEECSENAMRRIEIYLLALCYYELELLQKINSIVVLFHYFVQRNNVSHEYY